MHPTYQTLISTEALAAALDRPDWRVVDCRFSLSDPERGRRDFEAGHVPGALYAHLDEDLSARPVPGLTGRHPLPEPEALGDLFGRWGIDAGVQVVAYDDASGAIAARLWWLLRWMGHPSVAVLDGGWRRWRLEDRPVSLARSAPAPRRFIAEPREGWVIDAARAAAWAESPAHRLLDAREAERFRGEVEPIDPVAGHVPGAVSAPFAGNLDADGLWLAPEALRERFRPLLGGVAAADSAVYCGSGVTAAHDILAMAHAGLEGDLARLFAGSWSEWITDPARPVATGA